MAPKGSSDRKRQFDSEGAAAAKRARVQVDRRDLEKRCDRALADHVYPVLSKQIVETERVDNKTIRELIMEKLEQLGKSKRLGSTFWRDTIPKYSARASAIAQLTDTDDAQSVADELVDALEVATSMDNKERSTDALTLYLGYAPLINHKDMCLTKAVVGWLYCLRC